MISEGGSCGFVNYYSGKFWSGGHNYTLDENDDLDTFYLKSILESKQEKLYKLGVGSSLLNIQKHAIENFIVEIPKFQEQTVIGQFFHILDEQITTQDLKLGQLKQLKTAYLQKMFV
ncbi:hypothetical protein MmiHf6_14230 [Methanimicrococcus hongohii]|uniref:Type I restriction modification DNA specificity domain-containing protein n=2 Tax=Methanimicrococcus hongohii TaxID=3028295 RepID=A0AA96ZT24_9EURY|nr:hypothetical protein MmiHf6_14230 [Methanimicrococcus sp. Hf6]